MISVMPAPDSSMQDGIRPVNIQTDLASLADLIELSFRDTMDESGRAAIREMRYLSKLGVGLNLLSRLNDLMLGISQGYVMIRDGSLVGNVSIYPANWREELGKAWMIANVSTHPDYRGQGIARQLMHTCMDFIRDKGATHAILQVNYDNHPAIHLYDQLGFVRERAFTRWARSALVPTPDKNHDLEDIFFTKPRRAEWQQEYQLVQRTRPNERGGIGWLQPLHIKDFQPSLWQSLKRLFAFGDRERLIVRDDDNTNLLAMLWVERSLALSRTRLTLFKHPDAEMRYAEVLLSNVLRRYRSASFYLEHPHDDGAVSELLTAYRFRPHRTVWHMSYSY
ncbi:MAG: GNAT family N-acetyltransferase [Anaerolineae bacterium]